MGKLGIALDLGTSGFRGQLIELGKKTGAATSASQRQAKDAGAMILATAITSRHPLPGANVMDHLHFAIEIGLATAHDVVVATTNNLIERLIERVSACVSEDPAVTRQRIVRLAVCGNPIQISLFHEIEIRDLAYAGQNKLRKLGVVPPERNAQLLGAAEIRGLALPETAEVLIPPAVRHEIGADALAMMLKSGMLAQQETAVVTDYGTNAEMALVVNGTVYTGSTAAGPALEGQQIEAGMLALPGAICDVQAHEQHLETRVLDERMQPQSGDTVDPRSAAVVAAKGQLRAKGITGTGVIALIDQGLNNGWIRLPRIETASGELQLPDGIRFNNRDLGEAGKAVGAIRAGHLALCQAAGIKPEEIATAYMAGASGTYVDALKARNIGLVPAAVKRIHQVGNTSLAMARDMAIDPDQLWRLRDLASSLRQHHCMFATSKVFEQVYVLELSFWTEGLPLDQYQTFLKKFKLPPLPTANSAPEIRRTVSSDIDELGELGLTIMREVGITKKVAFAGCTGCEACVEECPQGALNLARQGDGEALRIDFARCNGPSCRRCEKACPEKVFALNRMLTL